MLPRQHVYENFSVRNPHRAVTDGGSPTKKVHTEVFANIAQEIEQPHVPQNQSALLIIDARRGANAHASKQ
jgi:hypothetical protein